VELYRGKRDTMLSALDVEFPDEAQWNRPEGGLFLWVTLPPSVSTREMFPKAVANDVAYVVGDAFFPNGGGANTMRLNFSHASDERIHEGVRRLAAVTREEIRLKATRLDAEIIDGF